MLADVLIAGAGPTGLIMAAELARYGVPLRIVDKAPHPTDRSKAIGIQARTLEIFEALGVVESFLSKGLRVHAVNVFSGNRKIVHIRFDELDSPYPFLLLLPQADTERILTAHLAHRGIQIERGVELRSLEQEPSCVIAGLVTEAGHEQARVPWLVGCDGAHSRVREQLRLGFEGKTHESRFLLADVAIDWDRPRDEIHIFVSEEGLFAVFPLPAGNYRIVADRLHSTGELPEPSLEEIQSVADARIGSPANFHNLNWSTYFHVNSRLVSRLRDGRVFLMGDAAHIHSPAGAQGMNTGIQDAANLAWKLAQVTRGESQTGLLDSYQIERYPVERNVLRVTDAMLGMAAMENKVARFVRDRVAPVLGSFEAVQQLARRTISEIAIEYRHSPIVEEHSLPSGPHAGNRAPDAELETLCGHGKKNLFCLFAAPCHSLLFFSGSPVTGERCHQFEDLQRKIRCKYRERVATLLIVPEPHDISWSGMVAVDRDGSVHRLYGASLPSLYLIRPDGYIAFRSLAADGKKLLSYLSRLFNGL